MRTATNSLAIGVFDSREQAQKAIEELCRAGFPPQQIGFLSREEWQAQTSALPTPAEAQADTGSEAGVVAGGVVGAILGGMAALTIPGVGPVIAAGILAGVLGGGAVGAWGGGTLGALIGMALPAERSHYYEEELTAGRSLVAVQAGDRYPEAIEILHRCGGTYLDPFAATPA